MRKLLVSVLLIFTLISCSKLVNESNYEEYSKMDRSEVEMQLGQEDINLVETAILRYKSEGISQTDINKKMIPTIIEDQKKYLEEQAELQKQIEEKKEAARKILAESFDVTVLKKEYQVSSAAFLVFEIKIQNKTLNPLQSIAGTIVISDKNNKLIKNIKYFLQETIQTGSFFTDRMFHEFHARDKADHIIRDTDLADLNIEFKHEMITFADKTRISLKDF